MEDGGVTEEEVAFLADRLMAGTAAYWPLPVVVDLNAVLVFSGNADDNTSRFGVQ